MSLAGLTFETFTEAGTRSWTEVPFGGEIREGALPASLPWDPTRPVVLPGTDIHIRGSIDRSIFALQGPPRGLPTTRRGRGRRLRTK